MQPVGKCFYCIFTHFLNFIFTDIHYCFLSATIYLPAHLSTLWTIVKLALDLSLL